MFLVSSGNDVKFHNNTNFDLVNVYRPRDTSGTIRSLSWCNDGSLLTLVPFKGSGEILRVKDDIRLIQSVISTAQQTACAVFQRTTKKHIALGTTGGAILIYDIKSRSVKKRFTNAGSTISMMDWSFKDSHLAVASTDGSVCIYSNTTNQKTSCISVPSSKTVSMLRFHKSNQSYLGCASDEGLVVVWDNQAGKKTFLAHVHQAPVTDISFSSNNHNLMASVSLDRTFQCYDTKEKRGKSALSVLTDQPLSSVDLCNDGYQMAVGSIRGVIYIYDLRLLTCPVSDILAHNTEIKNILYQVCERSPLNTGIDITDDKPSDQEVEILDIFKSRRNSSHDSFGMMMSSVHEFSPRGDCLENDRDITKVEAATGDSFLAELSPTRRFLDSCSNDKTNELYNLGITEGVKKWIDSKYTLMDASIPNHSGVMDSHKERLSDVITNMNTKPTSSTPKLSSKLSYVLNQDLPETNASPIVVNGASDMNMNDLKSVVKEVVNDVTEDYMSELMDQMSRSFLNLQLSFSKQFVNQEELIAKMSATRTPTHHNLLTQIELLKEENEFLKKKLDEKWQQEK